MGAARSRLTNLIGLSLGLIVIACVLNWIALAGVTSTIARYPVVGGPDLEQLVGANALCLQRGADAEEVAIFAVVPRAAGDGRNAQKLLLYLPRSSARWWVTTTKRPLYRVVFAGWIAAPSKP